MTARPRIYLSILALIAMYALMGEMDRAAAELDAQPWSVSTIRSGVPDDGIERIDDIRYAWLTNEECK